MASAPSSPSFDTTLLDAPAPYTQLGGSPCAQSTPDCIDGDVACHCANGCAGGPACSAAEQSQCFWQCDAPNAEPNCPPWVPNAATPCSPAGLTCGYPGGYLATCGISGWNVSQEPPL